MNLLRSEQPSATKRAAHRGFTAAITLEMPPTATVHDRASRRSGPSPGQRRPSDKRSPSRTAVCTSPVTTALLCCAYISGALHSGGLQRGTPEYADAQNVGATTVYEQLNMMVGPRTSRLRAVL